MEKAARMARITVPACLALIFLFSILTPEPGYVQGYGNDGIPAFVESDAEFSLYSSFAVIVECHPYTQRLPLMEQVPYVPSPTISGTLYRGPPSLPNQRLFISHGGETMEDNQRNLKTLLRPREVSAYFAVPLTTVYTWYQLAKIDGINVNGRCLLIFRHSVIDFLASRVNNGRASQQAALSKTA